MYRKVLIVIAVALGVSTAAVTEAASLISDALQAKGMGVLSTLKMTAVDSFRFEVVQNDNDPNPPGAPGVGFINLGDFIDITARFSSIKDTVGGAPNVVTENTEANYFTFMGRVEVTGFTDFVSGTGGASLAPDSGGAADTGTVTGDSGGLNILVSAVGAGGFAGGTSASPIAAALAADVLAAAEAAGAVGFFFEDTQVTPTNLLMANDTTKAFAVDGSLWAAVGITGGSDFMQISNAVGNSDTAEGLFGASDPGNLPGGYLANAGLTTDYSFSLTHIDLSATSVPALTDAANGIYTITSAFSTTGATLQSTVADSGWQFGGSSDVDFEASIIPSPMAAVVGLCAFGSLLITRRYRES